MDALRLWEARRMVLPYRGLLEDVRGLDLEWGELGDLFAFDERAYLRQVIYRTEHFEALFLCWRSGQVSPIHDHGRSSCVVRVVLGRATETRYMRTACGRLVPERTRRFGPGSTLGCCEDGAHQLGNFEAPGEDLVTFHVYSPPPAEWRHYPLTQTTLKDNDRLIQGPARTVRVDLGTTAIPGPHIGRLSRSQTRCKD
jgi:cysteine dioxygenase